jgi:riboflavin synthase
MFTGIVRSVGKVKKLERQDQDALLTIESAQMDFSSVQLGDSIATNGVCLTVCDLYSTGFVADVSAETLQCTTLGHYRVGSRVNLEPALTLNTPLGGHLVSGHVDAVGQVVDRHADGRSERFAIQVPAELTRYIAAKGSICVDGVSLTVNTISGRIFELNIVPHTLNHTHFLDLCTGQAVNIEVDLLARYIERLALGDQEVQARDQTSLNLAFLTKTGFIKS